MKIKLRTILAGPQGSHDAGSIVDLPDSQARELIEGHFAEPVEGELPETAEAAQRGRTADKPGPRPK